MDANCFHHVSESRHDERCLCKFLSRLVSFFSTKEKKNLTRGSHLLGKKSWNVYNADNVARVRRDEAAAKAAEEAEEQRMQEIDAQRRLAILRGETPPPIEDSQEQEQAVVKDSGSQWRPSGAKRQRKRAGEDDTEFELRVAKEQASAGEKSAELLRQNTSSAPIVDHAGNIDLFGAQSRVEKNEEAERDAQKKKREYEDQYQMRFTNATGRHGTSNPWYSKSDSLVKVAAQEPAKDVFGNDDPRRKERAAQRMSASDPLAMMKRGAAKVREIKQDRKKYQEERDEELRQLRRDEKRRERRRSRSPRSHRRRRSRSRSPRRHERERSRDRHRSREGHRDRYRDRDRDRGRDDDRRRPSDSRRRRSRS